ELRGQAGDLLFDQIRDPRTGGRLRGRIQGDVLLPGGGLDIGEIRNDERGDEAAPVADDRGVQDEGAGLQDVFDRRRSDQLSARGLEQVLFAVGDDQVAGLIEAADVAGG